MNISDGLKVTGTLNNQLGVARPDATAEFDGPNGIIGIFNSTDPITSSTEEGFYYYGVDSDHNPRKTASTSSKWVNNDTNTGFGEFRINAGVNGGLNDNVMARFFGNHGINFFGESDVEWPGDGILAITSTGGNVGPFNEQLDVRDSTQTKGVVLGHVPGTMEGAIGSVGVSSSLGLYSNDGTATARRIYISPDANVGINDNSPTHKLSVGGDVAISTAGGKFFVKEGVNASMGTVTLVGGIATVITNACTSNSHIFLQNASASGAWGALRIYNQIPGSFGIASVSNLDTSLISWLIIEPL